MITVVINGSSYQYPETNDTDWGNAATQAFADLTAYTLQKKNNGLFDLQNELSFGSDYGIKVLFISTVSNNPAANGVFKLSNGELVAWRNGNNDGDNSISFDASDNFVINGNTISFDVDGEMLVNGVQVTRSGEIVNADVADSAGIVESKLSLDYSTQSLYDNIENHKADTNNPHSVTKSQVLTGDLIVNSDVDDSAGIVESKLSLDYSTTALNTNIENHKADTSNPHDTKISNLDDVTIVSVQDKNILAYDSNSSKWKNITNSVNNLDGVSVTTPAAGQVLTYDGSNWTNQASASASLTGLTDTDITTPSNGDTLVYDSVTTKWENSDSLSTHLADTNNPHDTTISNLDDTTISTPSDQDTIVYDSNSSKWINQENSVDNLSNTDIDSNTVAENDVMVYDDVNQKWINSPILVNHIGNASNPHLTTVSKLTDTTITTPSDKQLLQYDYANLQWVNSSDVWSTIEVNDIANINTATTDVTLTASSKRHQIFTATNGFNITLPSTGIKAGEKFIFEWTSIDSANSFNTSFCFIIGSTPKYYARNGLFIYIFEALVDNPATDTDWKLRWEANRGVILNASVDEALNYPVGGTSFSSATLVSLCSCYWLINYSASFATNTFDNNGSHNWLSFLRYSGTTDVVFSTSGKVAGVCYSQGMPLSTDFTYTYGSTPMQFWDAAPYSTSLIVGTNVKKADLYNYLSIYNASAVTGAKYSVRMEIIPYTPHISTGLT